MTVVRLLIADGLFLALLTLVLESFVGLETGALSLLAGFMIAGGVVASVTVRIARAFRERGSGSPPADTGVSPPAWPAASSGRKVLRVVLEIPAMLLLLVVAFVVCDFPHMREHREIRRAEKLLFSLRPGMSVSEVLHASEDMMLIARALEPRGGQLHIPSPRAGVYHLQLPDNRTLELSEMQLVEHLLREVGQGFDWELIVTPAGSSHKYSCRVLFSAEGKMKEVSPPTRILD
jgi:hypothetical protein